MTSIGLRDIKLREWQTVRAKLKYLCIEVKRAFQRFWRGYDDGFLWNTCEYLNAFAYTAVSWLKEHKHDFVMLHDCNEKGLECSKCPHECEAEWAAILNEMVDCLRESDPELSSQQNEYSELISYSFEEHENGYSTMVNDHSDEIDELYHIREKEVDAYQTKCHDRAWELITKYFYHLWD